MHAMHFMLLERDGSSARVAANENGYMYHCHFLEHEDDGMMGQFTVIQNLTNPIVNWVPVGVDDILIMAPVPLAQDAVTY